MYVLIEILKIKGALTLNISNMAGIELPYTKIT